MQQFRYRIFLAKCPKDPCLGNTMTIVVSWISNEREFPTLETVADSRLTRDNTQ